MDEIRALGRGGGDVHALILTPFFPPVVSGALSAAGQVIAISSFTEQEVLYFGGYPETCSVVPPGIDPEPFGSTGTRERLAFREEFGLVERNVVLTVARLDERKGHDTVLAAIAQLAPDFEDLHYLIVGRGDPTRLLDMADQMRIGDRVTIIDYLEGHELANAYAAADVFAMVSRPGARSEVDGFGIVYLEAAASGLACVAGDLGGCGDAVVNGLTGLCVDPFDALAVSTALRSILATPLLAERLGSEGRNRVQSSFRRKSLQARVTNLLHEVVFPGESAQAFVEFTGSENASR